MTDGRMITYNAFVVKRYLRKYNRFQVETMHVVRVAWGLMPIAFIPKLSGCFHGQTLITFSRRLHHQRVNAAIML